MKRALTIASLILATTVFGVAQTTQPKPATQNPAAPTPATKAPAAATTTTVAAMPTTDQILDKYVQALGGKAA